MNVGQAIRDARQASGITQARLAAMLGISPQYLADIEQGRRDMPMDRVKDLPVAIRRVALLAKRAQLTKELAALDIEIAALDPGGAP